MKPYFNDSHITFYNKDCCQMDELSDNSVQCVVTSPPYWGLRKYSGEQDLIWGDNQCKHSWQTIPPRRSRTANDCPNQNTISAKSKGCYYDAEGSNICSLCGAWKGGYGLEPTPEMYVQHTIEILREIQRVLRKDGVCFWNIGDSYSGSWGNSGAREGGQREKQVADFKRKAWETNKERPASSYKHSVIKPKDLCLIPFRVAIASQTDGWWVRSVIIWSKPNPMPESVTDRPTESHEYILLLTKSSKYYWDADAVREPHADTEWTRGRYQYAPSKGKKHSINTDTNREDDTFAQDWGNPNGRNLRSVWTFPTQPYPEAHFAVFPEKLPEICIKAATKPDDIVLDPFMGAGTTLWVAKKLNRRAVGYELSEEYCKLALNRNRQGVIGL